MIECINEKTVDYSDFDNECEKIRLWYEPSEEQLYLTDGYLERYFFCGDECVYVLRALDPAIETLLS